MSFLEKPQWRILRKARCTTKRIGCKVTAITPSKLPDTQNEKRSLSINYFHLLSTHLRCRLGTHWMQSTPERVATRALSNRHDANCCTRDAQRGVWFHTPLVSILGAGLLATVSACGISAGYAGVSTARASPRVTAQSSQAPSSIVPSTAAVSSLVASASSAGTRGSGVQLPKAGAGVVLTAVGRDRSGTPTLFYESANVDAKAVSNNYLAKLKAAGYTVVAAAPSGETVGGIYKATQQDVQLDVEAKQTWTVGSLLTIRIHRGHVALPPPPSSDGLEKSVPASNQLTFMAAGENTSSQAFYGLSLGGSIDDFITSLKNAGYSVAPFCEDGEIVHDIYQASNRSKSFTFEYVTFFGLPHVVIVAPLTP
ncbi:hypothetical protein [Streptomyces chartreusis]|uniref:hypothetical protein n=1 Tax=Streptomyces chartreusis TaxID=1969 RepID=UPI0037FF9793